MTINFIKTGDFLSGWGRKVRRCEFKWQESPLVHLQLGLFTNQPVSSSKYSEHDMHYGEECVRKDVHGQMHLYEECIVGPTVRMLPFSN